MKKVGRIDISEQAVTPSMLTSLFENMKDFVRSEIKANNVVLKKEIRKVVKNGIKEAVDPLQSDIKLLQGAVTSHSSEIKQNRVEIQSARTELKQEIRDSEERLGNKIDKNAIRLDEHTTRITHLEEAR